MNHWRLLVSGSTRLSVTPGRVISIEPTRVSTSSGAAVMHDQAMAVLVALLGERGDGGVNLRLECLGQQPAGVLADALVDQRRFARCWAVVVIGCGPGDDGQYGLALPTDAPTSAC